MSRGKAKTLAALTDALGGDDGVKDALARAGKLGKAGFLKVLEKDFDLSIRELEANAQHHKQSGEDLMTRELLGPLRMIGYAATSDTNERGHADILVQSRKLNLKWIAEAKIHAKYDTDVGGLLQLITRYTSGADDNGAIVLYVYNVDAASMANDWRETLKNDARCATTEILETGPNVFRFRSHHKHPSGIEYKVRHHLVLLHHEPKDKSGLASAAAAG